MIGGTRNRKGEYQWCGNELYDWNCNLKRYSWQLTVWEKQKIIQALQYNSITVSINHIFALVLRKCHTDYMDDTDFYLQVPSLFNITQIFWSSEDRVKARFYSVESRQNKPKANHRNLLSTEHTERTRKKNKVKETPRGRCSSAFSSLNYLLWYALGLYCQERIIKNYVRLKVKISIIKLNNIKYWIETAETLAFRGCHVVSLCFKPRMISKTRKKTFKTKNQTKIKNN